MRRHTVRKTPVRAQVKDGQREEEVTAEVRLLSPSTRIADVLDGGSAVIDIGCLQIALDVCELRKAINA